MNPFFTSCSLRGSNGFRHTILLSVAALLLNSFNASAQGILTKTQNFDGAASTSSTYVTLTTSANATNPSAAGFFATDFTQPGTGAFGVSDQNNGTNPNTIPVIFHTEVFQAGSTGNKVTFLLGQKGNNGFDVNNSVKVQVSIGGTTVTALTILGPTSGAPQFNIGTGTSASGSFNTPHTVTQGTIATTSSPSAGSIANFTVNLPDFTVRTNVGVTITISAAKKSIVLIDDVVISSSKPLPVGLTRFAATAQANGIGLGWATAQEKNNDRFEVQRSADGAAFETVGTVKGQGSSSSAHAYAFADTHPLAGLAYYRLRQVDFDGSSAFSTVAAVRWDRDRGLAYPNPSNGSVTLPAGLGAVAYRVFNALGQPLLQGQAAGSERRDLTPHPLGQYLLELTGQTGRSTQRLLRE